VKITHLELETVQVNQRETWVFVLLHTDTGLTGLGELNPSAPRLACMAALRQMGQHLRGRDPRRIAALYAELSADSLDLVGVRALSALEQCLWDLLGQWLQVPLHVLLGGDCDATIRLYANITRATPALTPEAFAHSARGAVADGFSAVKLAPFGGKGLIDRIDHLEESIECVRATRLAVGPEIDIMLDCYGLFTARAALALIEALDDIGLYWFEEPVADDDFAGYLQVKEHCPVPLAGGERYEFRRGFWPALERQIFHIAMPDVGICGGIGELDKVASMAESRGIQIAPHGPFGPVTLAAGAQVMAAHPGFLMLEYPWGLNDWRAALVEPAERIVDSHYHLTDRPGLGLALNPLLLAAHRTT
jgi:galactonate dehydratase